MDSGDPTTMLFTKIRSLEPEYASKIIGYLLLQDVGERDLMRLALGPETLLQSMILRVKTQLGLLSNNVSAPSTPPSPSPLNPISRPPINGRVCNPNGLLDFCRNSPSSPSCNSSWSLNGVNPTGNNTRISPKSNPFLSFDSIRTGSIPKSSGSYQSNDESVADSGGDNGADLLDEQQLNDYLSFLDDPSSKTEELVDPRVPLDNGDTHMHRRSFSASDACLGSDDAGFGAGFKPCMYFSRGFCKNGDGCKFIHGGFPDNVEGNGVIVGSQSKMENFARQHEEMMRMKMAYQQQRLAAAQFLARFPHLSYEKRMDLLLHQQAHRAGAFPFGDERYWSSSPGRIERLERGELMSMNFGDQSNSASRQIYLTFPADSTFKDEDVANYFSLFGAVQDVRIPYQQKRMFGFVSFVHPETVKVVLARGNPHFICDSRVLVKPYKEKGKVLDKKQQHLLQQIERGSFSPCSSPSGIDSREQCDFHHGAKIFYDTQEMMRRKMEQADLQRAIELERRRFISMQLPEFKNGLVQNHQRSLSVGSPGYISSCSNQTSVFPSENIGPECSEVKDDNQIPPLPLTAATSELQLKPEINPGDVSNTDLSNTKIESIESEKFESDSGSTIKLVLPSSLFPNAKSAVDHKTDESTESEAKAAVSSSTIANDPEPPATLSGLMQ